MPRPKIATLFAQLERRIVHRLQGDRRRLQQRGRLGSEPVRQLEREPGGFVDREDVLLGVRAWEMDEVAATHGPHVSPDLLDAAHPLVADPQGIRHRILALDEEP